MRREYRGSNGRGLDSPQKRRVQEMHAECRTMSISQLARQVFETGSRTVHFAPERHETSALVSIASGSPWLRPSNQGSKEVRFSLWLRGKKFRSRIRFLQLSTGKVTQPQLSLGRGTWPHAGDRLYSPMANGNDPFPTHSGLQLVWRGVHSYRKHRFGN